MTAWHKKHFSGMAAALALALWTLTTPLPLAADDPAGHARKYKIEDLSWLSGRWLTSLDGATYDEIYSEPKNGSLMGIYRIIREDKVRAYGMMAISETGDGIVFRYRLVGTDLEPLKGHEEITEKRLLKITDKVIEFEGLRYELINPNKMTLDYTQKKKDGTEEVLHFVYYRPCAGFCMMP